MKEYIDGLLKKSTYGFEDLCGIMKLLRSPHGCPWDREQDHKSIRKNFIEETYEVAEAIDTQNDPLLREELGDVMLQVVFHSQIAEERGAFDINGVCDEICKKLIVRHPHIFADVKADTAETVLNNWDEIKKATKNQKTAAERLEDIPKTLPALTRAFKAGERAAKTGFDFETAHDAAQKITEEHLELEEAAKSGNRQETADEAGDLLFATVNTLRKLKIDPEEALNAATNKFINRFKKLEQAVINSGKKIEDLSLTELDKIWETQKNK